MAAGCVGVARRNGSTQQFVEERPVQKHSKDPFLALLLCPAGSIHHPEEVRLDPAHAFEAELATELLVLDGVLRDGGSVRLIHLDRRRIEMSEDVTPARRPRRQQRPIALCPHWTSRPMRSAVRIVATLPEVNDRKSA